MMNSRNDMPTSDLLARIRLVTARIEKAVSAGRPADLQALHVEMNDAYGTCLGRHLSTVGGGIAWVPPSDRWTASFELGLACMAASVLGDACLKNPTREVRRMLRLKGDVLRALPETGVPCGGPEDEALEALRGVGLVLRTAVDGAEVHLPSAFGERVASTSPGDADHLEAELAMQVHVLTGLVFAPAMAWMGADPHETSKAREAVAETFGDLFGWNGFVSHVHHCWNGEYLVLFEHSDEARDVPAVPLSLVFRTGAVGFAARFGGEKIEVDDVDGLTSLAYRLDDALRASEDTPDVAPV